VGHSLPVLHAAQSHWPLHGASRCETAVLKTSTDTSHPPPRQPFDATAQHPMEPTNGLVSMSCQGCPACCGVRTTCHSMVPWPLFTVGALIKGALQYIKHARADGRTARATVPELAARSAPIKIYGKGQAELKRAKQCELLLPGRCAICTYQAWAPSLSLCPSQAPPPSSALR
jgi:hypothetical protein